MCCPSRISYPNEGIGTTSRAGDICVFCSVQRRELLAAGNACPLFVVEMANAEMASRALLYTIAHPDVGAHDKSLSPLSASEKAQLGDVQSELVTVNRRRLRQ
jgi:hypothetical protein